MDMNWPADTLLVSYVARKAKRVAHPCLRLSTTGLGNVRPAGHIRPAKHLNVARELHLKFSK